MRTSTITGALLISGLALAGCSPAERASEQPPAPGTPPPAAEIQPAQAGGPEAPSEVPPTNTDHEFAQQLLSYDKQAKELTDVTKRSSTEEGTRQLAERWEKAQEPLKNRVEGWLKANPEQGSGSAPEDQNVGEMTRMPPVEQGAVAHLQETNGEEFEHLLAVNMAEHLDHTVEMARTELEDGSSQPMRDLAEHLIQTREPFLKQAKELEKQL